MANTSTPELRELTAGETRHLDLTVRGLLLAGIDPDYRDLPWWGRWLYSFSRWFRSLCTDAWSFRRKHAEWEGWHEDPR